MEHYILVRKNKKEEKAKAFVKEVMQGPNLEQRVTRLEKIMDAFLITGTLVNEYIQNP